MLYMNIINIKDTSNKLFFIGGVVRDELLGRESFDIDITYVGNAIEHCSKFGEVIQVNPDFGTVRVKVKQHGIDPLPNFSLSHSDKDEIQPSPLEREEFIVDFASTRSESYPRKGHLPVVEKIGCTLKEDVMRRDFTINALAKSVTTGEIVDYTGGLEDLKTKKLRVLHDGSFIDDPTRIIRALKFSVRFGFDLDEHTRKLQEDYLANRSKWDSLADKTLYTGCLDALYGEEGALEYRSLKFEEVMYEEENRQGVAVVNHTSHEVEYTRSIEHKHFLSESSPVTWISYEYPMPFEKTKEPYYPVNDEKNQKLYATYKERAEKDGILIGGRLAEYKYYDMDKTIRSALDLAKKVL